MIDNSFDPYNVIDFKKEDGVIELNPDQNKLKLKYFIMHIDQKELEYDWKSTTTIKSRFNKMKREKLIGKDYTIEDLGK